ncbi:hypothetical protein ICM05_09890 [Leucobacter sp. cx-42]|uniref:hypothetical protein n=1 Tax=unclassified Leucobacter TaxID=2621730 RepID=UPI00165D6C35|nr:MULTISPECIES: hypothetical protein [unclassified Leucobacter]MBC9954948.1 hypothetical protein [Leucobacter sp. cx-42]
MSSKPRVKLNLRGINKLLKSAQPMVDKIGREIAADADGNYEYVSNEHRWTGRGHIQTADIETARKDARNNELLKALGRNIK